MKNNELLKSMPVSQPVSAESLLITTTKSYIIARYYGWEPKEEDLEEIISHTSYFNINVDDAIYEVLTMPREEITI